MRNPSLIYDEGGNVIGASPDKQPPLVIPPEMRNLPNATPAQAPLVMPKGQLSTEGQTIPGQANAPLNVPKSLQNALGTTKSPVSTQAPVARQPQPLAPAAPAAPAPMAEAPLPSLDDVLKNPNIIKGMKPADLDRLRFNLSTQGANEETLAKIDQAKLAEKTEGLKTKALQDYKTEQSNLIDQHKKDIQEASPFAPTPESAKDVASLFALISVAAFGSGGKGKYAGMQTLASLTGAMKGYQEGRKDVYEKDIKAFEENLKVLKSHNDKVNALYEDAMKLLSTDKELGLQKIQEIMATDNTGIITRLARSGQYKAMGEAVGAVSATLTAAQDKVDKLKNEYNLLAKRFQNEKELVDIREVATLARFREEKKYEKPEVLFNEAGKPFYIDTLTKKVVPLEGGMEGMRKTQAKPTGQLGPTAFLKDIIGKTSGSDKGDQKIVDLARGVSEMDHVITLFRDPSVKTGVLSKLSGIREKLASLGKGDPNHEITDDEFQGIVDGEISSSAKNAVAQKEALFAAYTAEREIAGGRLLVSVIKQAGGALDPTNYEKEGYLNLLASRKNQLVKGLRGAHLTDNEIQSVIDGVNKSTLKPSATQSVAESKQKATPEEIKAYADEHFKGNQDAARADLKKKGFL